MHDHVRSRAVKRVAIWRDEWLPSSETFILDQIDAMSRWTPVPMAAYRSGHPSVGSWTPFPAFVQPRIATLLMRTKIGRRIVARRLMHSNVSVLHAHFGTGGITVLPIALRLEIPLVVTFHGFDASRLLFGSGLDAIKYRSDIQRVFKGAHALVAVSDFIASNLIRAGAPADKIHVLPIGTRVAPPRSREAGQSSGLLFVGRLVKKKGVDDLLRAVGRLDEPHRSTRLTIVGGGPERAGLEGLARELGLDAIFTGPLAHQEVRRLMSEALLFVAPSRTAPDGDAEGFGMVFLEAAQAGLAAVAYKHGGVVEAVIDGQTGLLAPEGDVDALSQNLGILLQDPERATVLGRQARERVEREFQLDRRTRALEDLYDSVTSPGVFGP